jgi:hypothetical protein
VSRALAQYAIIFPHTESFRDKVILTGVFLYRSFCINLGVDAMNTRRFRCLSAASVLALSLAWTPSAQATILYLKHPVQDEGSAPAQSASDLLMSLTLRGYDLFSASQFRAAMENAQLVPAAMPAGFAPEMMAHLRSLDLGEAHTAAAAAILRVSASPSPSSSPAVPVKASNPLDLNVAEITCDPSDMADCTTETDDNQGRGTENYSG